MARVADLPRFVRPPGRVFGISDDAELLDLYERQRVPRNVAATLVRYVSDSIPFTRALRVSKAEFEADESIDANGREYDELRDEATELQNWLTYDAPPLARDTVVWRGQRTHRDTKPYYYSAITGWSLNPDLAMAFAGYTCCLFRMTLPKGTHAFATRTNEYEILIGKHQIRTVRSAPFARANGDTIMVHDLQLIV